MIDKIRIEYVDKLPMVNSTDSFLIAKQAVIDLKKDQVDFFPHWWSHCQSKLFKVQKTGDLIALFARNGTVKRFLHKQFFPENLGDLKKQAIVGRKLISDIYSPEKLAEKFHSPGLNYLGIYPNNVFSISDYGELLHVLIGNNKINKSCLRTFRFFSIFLASKDRFLWPIADFKQRQKWPDFTICNSLFGCSLPLPKIPDKHRVFIAWQANDLVRAVRWRKSEDLNNEDISKLREHISTGKMRTRVSLLTALNIIVNAAIDSGVDLEYISPGQRISKTLNTGRSDGSFSFLEEDKFKYWRNILSDYVKDKNRKGTQSISGLCEKLNSWPDYLLYLDAKGITYPQSMIEVDRSRYIEYRPSAHLEFKSYVEWMTEERDFSMNRIAMYISGVRSLFDYVISTKRLAMHNPIIDIDAPVRRDRIKSHRMALTLAWWTGLLDMLCDDPPLYYEKVRDEDGQIVMKESPSFPTYLMTRLMYGIRHHQAAYLDKDKVLREDGIEISGDKNPNRKRLQIAPYIDERLKVKIEQCREWQEKYNFPADTVFYGGYPNSPFGKVSPLFRPIGRTGTPFGREVCDRYMKRAFLKYQKKANMPPEAHIIVGKDGTPIDMSTIDPDTITVLKLNSLRSLFDLHSLRVTAATIWYEQGISLEVIAEFLTGHASLTMLRKYIDLRSADQLFKEKYRLMREKQALQDELKTNTDAAIDKFYLTSRTYDDSQKELEGTKLLKETPAGFRHFMDYGICPTGACLPGRANKCSLCPQFVTAPSYKTAIAAQINLMLDRLEVCRKEIRASGSNTEHRRGEIEELIQCLTGWYCWYHVLEAKEKEIAASNGGTIVVYTQESFELRSTSPILLQLQRAIDIVLVPEVFSEHTHQMLREMLARYISRQERQTGMSGYDVVSTLNSKEVIDWTVKYYLNLINRGMSEDEIVMMFSPDVTSPLPLALKERLIGLDENSGDNL